MMSDDSAAQAHDALARHLLPPWVPQVRTIRIPCGEQFDAIRVPAGEARRAHEVLGPASGPVLACTYTQTWHFLLDPNTIVAAAWNVPGTRLLRQGTVLGIPPAFVTRGRDVRWIVLPGRGTTTPAALRHALAGRASPIRPGAIPLAERRAALLEAPFPRTEGTIFTPRSAAERTRLTPTEKRVAERLVAGCSNEEGARELDMTSSSFSGHLSSIGRKFRVAARAARAHAVLTSGQVPPPSATAPAPDFDATERQLLDALAEQSTTYAIAQASGLAPADVREQIEILVTKASAANDTHLVGLCHAWGLLGTGSTVDAEHLQVEPEGAA
ncbi:LuxR C-terminal-related transcriptional regulator [Streptomyces sp. S1D4-20]|uniref:LuxR C-terminal-related transcriptional regulator n=1 Tax=Streptomyces sp. S1D4-20 TaxID=2594462 RepID=UPI0013DEF68B|nr:LuxR C-terminal-related transcriptional regulator [Streptomyces sp. S1D4-20]